MNISISDCIINDIGGFEHYTYAGTDHLFRGFVYVPGKKAGQESAAEIARLFSESGKVPFSIIRGSYSYIIRRDDGDVIVFSDNSNQHVCYVSDGFISDSFEEILRSEYMRDSELLFDMESVCEYLSLGRTFFDKTFVEGIAMLSAWAFILIKNGEAEIFDKRIGDIDAGSTVPNGGAFFADLAHSLADYKISSALTGGYDSRMVYCCMLNRVDVSPCLCSNFDSDREKAIAQRVASATGKRLDVIHTPKPEVSDEFLLEQLKENDFILPNTVESNYVTAYLRQKMTEDGFRIHLTGDGGVLHKDWEWMQDLPFYHRKHTDLRRFYRQRIAAVDDGKYLGERLKQIYISQEERFVEVLKKYVKSTNTQSYDSLYFWTTGNRAVYYNMNDGRIPRYAPLDELDFVKYSYGLPRGKRFFYSRMRETTTEENAEAARIPTVYGTTASSEPLYIIRDVSFQFIDYGRKALLMLGRKLLNRNLFGAEIEDWSLEDEIRETETAKAAVLFAVEKKIVSPEAAAAPLNYRFLLRVIHIFLLCAEFGVEFPADNY
jgi:hypothetical protein